MERAKSEVLLRRASELLVRLSKPSGGANTGDLHLNAVKACTEEIDTQLRGSLLPVDIIARLRSVRAALEKMQQIIAGQRPGHISGVWRIGGKRPP